MPNEHEKLMRDALTAIQKLQAENQALRSELAKARNAKPATVSDAVAKALRNPQGGAKSAWHLLPGLVAAQKSRLEHEAATPDERIAKAEQLLRKASGR